MFLLYYFTALLALDSMQGKGKKTQIINKRRGKKMKGTSDKEIQKGVREKINERSEYREH